MNDDKIVNIFVTHEESVHLVSHAVNGKAVQFSFGPGILFIKWNTTQLPVPWYVIELNNYRENLKNLNSNEK